MQQSFVVFFILMNFILVKQSYTQVIDSLENSLNSKNITDSTRIVILNDLSREYSFIDSKKSLEFAKLALQLAQQSDNKLGEAFAYRNLANLYNHNAMYFNSMDYLQLALSIFEQENDSNGMANCYISLAYMYRNLTDTNKEISYNRLAFKYFNKLKLVPRIGVAAHNLSESYYLCDNLDSAEYFIKLAIEVNSEIKQNAVLTASYKVMGQIEQKRGNYAEAEKYYKKALEISEFLGIKSQKRATIESMMFLSDLYALKNDFTKSLEYLDQAVTYCNNFYLPIYLPDIYRRFIRFYSELNNNTMKQKYLDLYFNITDSIKTINLKDKSELVSSLAQLRALEIEKQKLIQTQQQQEASLQFRNILLSTALVVIGIVVAMLILLRRANKKVQGINLQLQTRNTIIKQQNEKMAELIATKDRLFTIIAHDLRSPFNAILGFSDLLLSDFHKFSPDRIKMMIKNINHSAANTLDLLEKLLTWARNQTGAMSYKPQKFKFIEIQSQVAEAVSSNLLAKNIQYIEEIEEDLLVLGDKNMMRTILINLIQNSVKFTNEEGRIQVVARKNNNQQVEISVSDNGIGMSEEIKEKLFTIDRSIVKPGTNAEKGTGLGLLLCKDFIEKQGGTIKVESEEGKGSRFTITFPGIEEAA